MKRHLLVLFAVLSVNAGGQTANQPPPLIVGSARLLNSIKSPTLKAGDLFFLRTTALWHQGDCTIPSHTTITGHVESLTSSPTWPYDTVLTISFSGIPCTESKSTLMTPLLLSIKAPGSDDYNNDAAESLLLHGIFSSEMNRQGSMSRANDPASINARDAAALALMNSAPVTEKPMKTGEVRGYRGIALTVPGREGPAAKLFYRHKIVFASATEFEFAYASASSETPDAGATSPPPAPIASPTANPPAPAVVSPPPAEIEDVCVSSGCRQLSAPAETAAARALWSLPIAQLGYQHRPAQLVVGLDSSASVHFLGDDQILLTFTRHLLLPRSSDADAWTTRPRSVRGVLISRADGHVLRVKDWTVSDDIGPFVWSLGNGLVIAHVGHDLVRFGPGLAIEQRFPLAGPLLLLSASPRGNLLLAVTVHEKHTKEDHALIATFVGPGVPIDEEYDLTGLTDAFQVTGAKRVTVRPLRPALLQNSMVSVRPMNRTEWLLEESTWEGQTKPFAHFRSSCPLEIQSFPGDLLFIQGCTPVAASTWYRVLNAQGATLFKGSRPSTDLIQQAESSYDGRLFAIALSDFRSRYVDRTTVLKIADFTNLTVTVYDTATGKRFFVANPLEGSAQADTFSLSPSGSALAVLTSSSLQLFPVPAPAEKK